MKRDFFHELAVQEAGEHVHQSDPPEVSTCPLGDQDDSLPCAFLGQLPITERCLHGSNDLLKVGCIRCVIPSPKNQPLA